MDFEYGKQKCLVKTAYGTVRGYREDGVYIFKGMQYARAGRFEAPSAPPAWEGIRDAAKPGPVFPQAARLRTSIMTRSIQVVFFI